MKHMETPEFEMIWILVFFCFHKLMAQQCAMIGNGEQFEKD